MKQNYIVGLLVGLATVVAGVVLEWTLGSVESHVWAFPLNVLVLAVLMVAGLIVRFGYRGGAVGRWVVSPSGTVGVLSVWIGLLLVLGSVVQQTVGLTNVWESLWRNMVVSWPFVLMLCLVLWMLTVVVLYRKPRLSWRYAAFLLNHLGLWLLLAAGLMGAADKQQYQMLLRSAGMVDQAVEADGRVHVLAERFGLLDFKKEYYPNKLAVLELDTMSGKVDRVRSVTMESGCVTYRVEGYEVQVPHADVWADSLRVVLDGREWMLSALNGERFVPLAPNKVLVMIRGDVRRYEASIRMDRGVDTEVTDATIAVNDPCRCGSYDVYLESYDSQGGVVIRLVEDGWLWMAYGGLWSLIAGSVLLFVLGPVGRHATNKV